MRARRTVEQAIHAEENEVDRTELIRLLEEEMLEAARNLEFERAAQLRDKLAEIRGAPVLTGAAAAPMEEPQRIWQPKNKGKPNRRMAK